jgi:hypothetical protein
MYMGNGRLPGGNSASAGWTTRDGQTWSAGQTSDPNDWVYNENYAGKIPDGAQTFYDGRNDMYSAVTAQEMYERAQGGDPAAVAEYTQYVRAHYPGWGTPGWQSNNQRGAPNQYNGGGGTPAQYGGGGWGGPVQYGGRGQFSSGPSPYKVDAGSVDFQWGPTQGQASKPWQQMGQPVNMGQYGQGQMPGGFGQQGPRQGMYGGGTPAGQMIGSMYGNWR